VKIRRRISAGTLAKEAMADLQGARVGSGAREGG